MADSDDKKPIFSIAMMQFFQERFNVDFCGCAFCDIGFVADCAHHRW